ncbi:UDP-N-acetylmuramate--L-alanine ligase [Patescibacteria group bacterium]|nr:UDP-N-acetylmuramate--L-alanine ligase [Patescibacteria group bacterium]
MTSKTTKVHFMGIGGSGASAVARIAKEYGYKVTGCDLEESSITYRLRKEGIPVAIGHDVSHLKNTGLLVHTPAVFYQSLTHPEYTKANEKGIALTWEEFMAKYLQKGKYTIAVAGTHGKGTTTALICRVLETAGLDPTCEIGANLLDWEKKNDRIGKSKYFVFEADEFRDKFLIYKPDLAVITSIEMDHPEYFKDFNQIMASFVKFASKAQILVVNAEDEGCNKLLKKLKMLKNLKLKIIKYKKLTKSQAKLKLPGEHLRSDAAAAWIVAKTLGVKDQKIREGLESFGGLERRFEYRGEVEGAKIYDDYAHHPTAVAVNIAAAREIYPKKKIWVVFQPHMHARLEKLFEDFKKELAKADKVVVTDVYTRRESGVTKPSGKDLALAIGGPKATYVGGELVNVANFLARNLSKNDVVLIMGAGDVYEVSNLLLR